MYRDKTVSLGGPVITIRRFPKQRIDMKALIAMGSVDAGVASVLRILVQAGYNIFISGGTGSGKTTMLNALSDFVPKDARIVTIEDSAELQIRGVEIWFGWRHARRIWRAKTRSQFGI